VLAVELAFAIAAARVEPDNLVEHPFGAKDFVHQAAKMVRFAKIAVQVDRSVVGEQIAQRDQAFVHKLEVGVIIPCITIFDIRNRDEARRSGTAQADATQTINARTERRIDVDQVDPSPVAAGKQPRQSGQVLAVEQEIVANAAAFDFESGGNDERFWRLLAVPREQRPTDRR
jgi:hypothetical protein